MPDSVSLLIADDHELIRGGLRNVLQSNTAYQVTETGDGIEALRMIRERKLDVAILDIEMPGLSGYEVAKHVFDEGLPVSVIFLTMFKDESLFNKALDIGVKGYVLKENTVAEILSCLNAVLAGNYYLSPAISDFLVRRNLKPVAPVVSTRGLDLLSPAERNVLKHLAMMKTNQDIATDLFISVKTVQNHRNNICHKLGLNGTHALLKFALEMKA
jgi:DNA-binding NarL/FixJ family response regulator